MREDGIWCVNFGGHFLYGSHNDRISLIWVLIPFGSGSSDFCNWLIVGGFEILNCSTALRPRKQEALMGTYLTTYLYLGRSV
jgi:hypothetical protein